MASKRKWDEFDDSDDEEPSFGRQILPVANLPEDFDGTPCDGMQYLFTVRYVWYILLVHRSLPLYTDVMPDTFLMSHGRPTRTK